MTSPEIHFHAEKKGFSLEDPDKVKEWLFSVAEAEQKVISLLNYIFCDDEQLLEINRQYLGHDYYTDIISFPMKEDPVEGDIFISIDRVSENAGQYDTPFRKELSRVMVHGLLHFFGYDDHEESEKKIMRQKENHYLPLLIS